MRRRLRLFLGIGLIAVFGVLGLMNFKQSMTPYDTFAEARTMGRTIQVAGFPDHARSGFDAASESFRFTITDEDGETMKVVYHGGKPGNFDQANSVVVIGDYDEGVLRAKQILVKCPSKYEGLGEEHPEAEEAEAS